MPLTAVTACVHLVNGAAMDYRCFVATTTGYFAVEDSSGALSIYPANRPQVIPASEAVALWACGDLFDPRPAGDITALDCSGLDLVQLDIRGLAKFKTLDCSHNQLAELDLSGLSSLEILYCHDNPLSFLNFSLSPSLDFIRCASRFLGMAHTPPASLGPMVCHDGPMLESLPANAGAIFSQENDTRCAAKYISPRTRLLTADETLVRSIAYSLKTADQEAITTAAPLMAALITGPCWLVPIPASDCSLDANIALTQAIADLVPGARIKLAVARSKPVESSTVRRKHRKLGLEPHEHNFVRTAGPMNPLPLYFIDNVITTGNTIRAARSVLGWGIGLAYADASSPFNTKLSHQGPPKSFPEFTL